MMRFALNQIGECKRQGIIFFLAIIVVSAVDTNLVSAQHWLVLRDRGVESIQSPISLDITGVIDSGDNKFGWERIVSGNVGDSLQSNFDAQIKNFGEPLFQIQSAIARGDWLTAEEYSNSINTESLAADHLVFGLQAVARHRAAISVGDPASAAVHLIHFCENRSAATWSQSELLKPWMKEIELEKGFSGQLAPVWIDRISARIAFNTLQQTWPDKRTSTLVGRYIYGISLALAAGETESAERLLNLWKQDFGDSEWLELTTAAIDICKGKTEIASTNLASLVRISNMRSANVDSNWYLTARFWQTVCEAQSASLDSPVEIQEAWRFLAIESQDSSSQIALIASLMAEAQAREADLASLLPSATAMVELQRSRREGYNCQIVSQLNSAKNATEGSGN